MVVATQAPLEPLGVQPETLIILPLEAEAVAAKQTLTPIAVLASEAKPRIGDRWASPPVAEPPVVQALPVIVAVFLAVLLDAVEAGMVTQPMMLPQEQATTAASLEAGQAAAVPLSTQVQPEQAAQVAQAWSV